MGAQLVKEAASKTSDVAGDGTTTVAVLVAALRSARADRRELRQAIGGGVLALVGWLLRPLYPVLPVLASARTADRPDGQS